MTTSGNLGTNDYEVGGMYDTWGDAFVADMAILNKFAGDTHTVADTTGTVTLTVAQCQNFSFRATGGTASQVDIRVPDSIARYWYVRNDRASGAITVRCAAGGDVITLAAGERRLVYSDGSDCADLTLLTLAIASVSGLQAALDAKAGLAGPTFTGNPQAPTPSPGDNDQSISTTGFVKAAIDVVLGGVSSSFDTLAEIVAGMQPLNDDLTAIAALTTTSYGRAFLELANQAALVALLPSFARLDVEEQVVTGGARVTSKDLGTPAGASTVTLDPGDRPLQHLTNNAAFTLAPGANTGSIILDITNGASAGAITTSGFTKVIGSFVTTNTYKFRCVVVVGNAGSTLTIQAMQ